MKLEITTFAFLVYFHHLLHLPLELHHLPRQKHEKMHCELLAADKNREKIPAQARLHAHAPRFAKKGLTTRVWGLGFAASHLYAALRVDQLDPLRQAIRPLLLLFQLQLFQFLYAGAFMA